MRNQKCIIVGATKHLKKSYRSFWLRTYFALPHMYEITETAPSRRVIVVSDLLHKRKILVL